MTYAGHTTWNVRNEHIEGEGYKNGRKRKPREEWQIERDTHPALISEEEAEALISQLENSTHSRKRRTPATYLLTNLLEAPNGESWFGDGNKHYRLKPDPKSPKPSSRGRWIPKSALEDAVLGQIKQDMVSPEFTQHLAAEARKYFDDQPANPSTDLRRTLLKTDESISKMMDLAAQLEDPGPALRKIEELERQRKETASELQIIERAQTAAATLAKITQDDVREALAGALEQMQAMRAAALKDYLTNLIEKIQLNPETLECCIHYRVGFNRNKMASPRGVEPLLPP